MNEIQIVKLKPEEWPLYKQIRLESLLNEPQSFVPMYTDALQNPDTYWQGRLQDAEAGERSWLLFAREADRLAGMIGAFRSEGSDEVEIVSVYVSPDRRGQNLGKALMKAILAEVSRPAGIQKAVLAVNMTQSAAIALYRQFGFQVVGEKSGVMGDGQMHTGYVMEKPLRSG